MNTISEAVVNKFAETSNGVFNSFYTALDGRMYAEGSTPAKELFPYVTFSIVSETYDELLDGSQIIASVIQFDLYSNQRNSAWEINRLFFYLTELYDDVSLGLIGNEKCTQSERGSARLMPEDDLIWHYIVRYDVKRFTERTAA